MRGGGGALRSGRALATLALLLLAQPAALWHAFGDQKRMPDVPGTSLRSDLSFATDAIDLCQAATLSLRKALLVCGQGYPCDLKCAASWNSAMRDARAVTGASCAALERLMNTHLVGDLSRLQVHEDGSLFQLSEWDKLRAWCEHDSVCGRITDYSPLVNPCADFEGQCREDMPVAGRCVQLTPPLSACPAFSFHGQPTCSGSSCYKALTWLSLQQYQKQGLGCVGGLGDKSDAEYTTWACIHDPSCQYLVDEKDHACFKYSHVRGEFHFWDFNSNLRLISPLEDVGASFCADTGVSSTAVSSLRDAVTGLPVDLSEVTYLFERILIDGTSVVEASGYAPDLGSYGCGIFRLAKNATYRVQIDAGSNYLKWVGLTYTFDTDISITAGLYPVIKTCSNVGLTLSWCEQAEVDLDLWIFMPGSNKEIQTDQSHAVYWHAQSTSASNYSIKLDFDDKGVGGNLGDQQGNSRSFGPESIHLEGDLPEGTYAIMVHAYSGNPSSTLAGKCPLISLYSTTNSAMDAAKPVEYLVVGEKGRNGNWWHVMNLIVTTVGTGTSLFKKLEYAVVDKMIPMSCSGTCGPAVDAVGNIVNSFEPSLRSTTAQPRKSLFAFVPATGKCGLPVAVGITVRDAVTNADLESTGQFAMNWGEGEKKHPVTDAKLDYVHESSYDGGFQVLSGTSSISAWAVGYMTATMNVMISPTSRYFQLFSIPSDGQTRVVLNWGNRPSDLDLYVVPADVVGFDRNPVAWKTLDSQLPVTDQLGQDPYVYSGLSRVCSCSAMNNPCLPTCALSPTSNGGAPAYKTTLSLDREDKSHGIAFAGDSATPTAHDPDLRGLVGNGCETATLRNLLPGESSRPNIFLQTLVV